MKRTGTRTWAFAAIAVVLAGVFVRLGIWQLDRLGQRRAANAARETRIALPPLEPMASDLPLDSVVWRRATARGAWEPADEIVVRGRAHLGSPGVHVVTPLRLDDGSAILVLRGWLPAADGLSADLASARLVRPAIAGPITVAGLVLRGERESPIPPRWSRFGGAEHLVLGSLSADQAREAVEGPLAPYYLLPLEPEAVGGPLRPVSRPTLSDGPHLLYAFQWFAFATISIVGTGLYLRGKGSGDRSRLSVGAPSGSAARDSPSRKGEDR
jgi:surfeit locus 1 family protein